MLDPRIVEDITLMTNGVATPEQLDYLLTTWQAYFEKMKIPLEKQEVEFRGIIRMRVSMGSISLVSPLEAESKSIA